MTTETALTDFMGPLSHQQQESHRKSLSHMNAKYDPMQSIPPEVVSHIFEDALGPRPLVGALRLGEVCRYWRQVAWTTPSLWNELEFIILQENDKKGLGNYIENFQDYLFRSRSLSLSINIHVYCDFDNPDVMDQLIETISTPSVIHRVERLHIRVPKLYRSILNRMSTASKLRTLSFREYKSTSPDTAETRWNLEQLSMKLEELTTSSDSLLSHLSTNTLSKLIDLTAEYCSHDTVLSVMRQAPLLRRCFCALNVRNLSAGTQSSFAQTVMPQLSHLTFSVFSRNIRLTPILEQLTLPALQDLEIKSDIDVPTMVSLFKRSNAR